MIQGNNKAIVDGVNHGHSVGSNSFQIMVVQWDMLTFCNTLHLFLMDVFSHNSIGID